MALERNLGPAATERSTRPGTEELCTVEHAPDGYGGTLY